MICALFLQTAEVVEDALASPRVAERWDDPSALEGYTVAGLAGHLARAVLTVARYLDAPPPDATREPVDAAGYLVEALADHDPVTSDLHTRVRQRGAEAAADGPQALVDQVHEARLEVFRRLPGLAPDHRVGVFGGTPMRLDDYLETRLVELVVHLDDLAVSVGGDVERVPAAAFEVVATVLARVAARRVGGLATVRALARRERHPDAVRAL